MANIDEWWKSASNGNAIFFPDIPEGSAQIVSLIDPLWQAEKNPKSFPANY